MEVYRADSDSHPHSDSHLARSSVVHVKSPPQSPQRREAEATYNYLRVGEGYKRIGSLTVRCGAPDKYFVFSCHKLFTLHTMGHWSWIPVPCTEAWNSVRHVVPCVIAAAWRVSCYAHCSLPSLL